MFPQKLHLAYRRQTRRITDTPLSAILLCSLLSFRCLGFIRHSRPQRCSPDSPFIRFHVDRVLSKGFALCHQRGRGIPFTSPTAAFLSPAGFCNLAAYSLFVPCLARASSAYGFLLPENSPQCDHPSFWRTRRCACRVLSSPSPRSS